MLFSILYLILRGMLRLVPSAEDGRDREDLLGRGIHLHDRDRDGVPRIAASLSQTTFSGATPHDLGGATSRVTTWLMVHFLSSIFDTR